MNGYVEGFVEEAEESFLAHEIAMAVAEDGGATPVATSQGLFLLLTQLMGEFVNGVMGGSRAGRELSMSMVPALLWHYGQTIGVDLADELDKTWARVSQRDWVASPLNADKLAG